MMEVKNKKAYFDYFIESELEAGIVLKGTEIKSGRGGNPPPPSSMLFSAF